MTGDVDELTAAKRDLAAAKAELQSAVDGYKAFAYSVSHDLRAPLRAISGFAALLEQDLATTLSEDNRRLLGIICDSARTMNAQLDGLLVLSRLEHRELESGPVDMTALAQAAVEQVQVLEPSHAVQARVDPLATVTGDAKLLQLALVELVRNAWKFTRTTPAPSIAITCKPNGREAIYRVADNGVGLPPGAAERLFVVFRRMHGKEYEGLGLGLATVKSIVNRHRGRVWVESQPDRGATFSFSLPIA
jgi:signal transduction histidine kinase